MTKNDTLVSGEVEVRNECSIISISEDKMTYKVASPNGIYIVNKVRPNSRILRCNCIAGQNCKVCKHITCVILYWKEIGEPYD